MIQPPVEDFYDTDIRLQPIGLAYLKASVNLHLPKTKVKIVDFHHGWGRRTVSLPKELRYLKEYYNRIDRSPFRLFHNYFRFGATNESIQQYVKTEAPDVVGISSLFTAYYRETLQVAHCIREVSSAWIVVGGSHTSAVPESLLSESFVDFVIRGEGEIPLVELLRLLSRNSQPESEDLNKIPGLGFKKGKCLIYNPLASHPDISALPKPELSDLPPANYLFQGRPLTFLITSRSCPHRCSFCSVHTTFGNSYRRRSVDDVLSEIRLRISQGYQVIDFEDDNLTLQLPDMKDLCHRLAEESLPDSVEFTAMNGISYLSLDLELLQLMRKVGFQKLNLSLVSSDSTVLQTTKRPHTVQRFQEIVSFSHKLGFSLTAYQILGLPHESLESMVQTLCFLTEQPVLLGGSPFYLIPESPIARAMNIENDPEIMIRSRLTALALETDHFSRDDIYTLFVAIRILNFLKKLKIPNGTAIGFKNLLKNFKLAQDFNLPQAEMAFRSLKSLFEEGILLGFERNEEYQVIRFRTELWFQIWEQLKRVATLSNGSVIPKY